MPFHEIREVGYSAMFNKGYDRRRHPESAHMTSKKLVRRRGDAHRADPAKEVDILA